MAETTWREQLAKLFPEDPENQEFIRKRAVQETAVDSWDAKPLRFKVRGVEMELFTIGQLGRALGDRSPNTLRAWEKEGIIPKSPYVKPSTDPRGRRRLYSRDMVEGMMRIAREEGVLWPHKGVKLSATQFQPRVRLLFQKLLAQ